MRWECFAIDASIFARISCSSNEKRSSALEQAVSLHSTSIYDALIMRIFELNVKSFSLNYSALNAEKLSIVSRLRDLSALAAQFLNYRLCLREQNLLLANGNQLEATGRRC